MNHIKQWKEIKTETEVSAESTQNGGLFVLEQEELGLLPQDKQIQIKEILTIILYTNLHSHLI